jgi:hypothetical protein
LLTLAADGPGKTRGPVGLLKLLIQKVPQGLSPLIPRPDLAKRVNGAVDERRVVLLTGTVYKGNTTIAQQVV